VAVLHGQMPDVDIQNTVKAFGSAHAPLRLLIASDVASEGLNLHYQSHRLIHFDISWSLMVFQQRNGRVDRYGQLQVPKIGYMLTVPQHERTRGDLRYLEILIDKDEQAAKNIGDPSAFMGLYDEELEVAKVAAAMESNTTAEAFAAQLAQGDVDPFEALWGAAQAGAAPRANEAARCRAQHGLRHWQRLQLPPPRAPWPACSVTTTPTCATR
jgi:superfamily II DNA/RNA helicase